MQLTDHEYGGMEVCERACCLPLPTGQCPHATNIEFLAPFHAFIRLASQAGTMIQCTVVYESHGAVDMNMWEANNVGKQAKQGVVDETREILFLGEFQEV